MPRKGRALEDKAVKAIRRGYARGERARDLAMRYDRNVSTIYRIVVGRNYRDVPGAIALRPPGAPPGSRHGRAKLREIDIVKIRELRTKQRLTLQAIADAFGVSSSLIARIAQGTLWSHVPVSAVDQ